MNQLDLEQTATASPPATDLEWPVERVIVPAKRRLKVSDLVRHADVIRVIAGRDYKVKYKQSALGPLWLVFQPLALLLAFIIAFQNLTKVASSGVPYVVFTLVGLSAWSFFQAAVTIGASSIVSNINYIRYTPCPRTAFPLSAIVVSLPSFAVPAIGALIAAAVTDHLSPLAVLLPFGLAWLVVLTAGVVGIACCLAVRYRDIISVMPFLLQVGVFLAPVGYTLAGLSGKLRTLVELNPLTGVMEAWRGLVITGYHPRPGPIAVALVETVVLAAVGWWLFSRMETTMADEI